jgi:hypothetical protein
LIWQQAATCKVLVMMLRMSRQVVFCPPRCVAKFGEFDANLELSRLRIPSLEEIAKLSPRNGPRG